jgi:hypothetical protein
MMGFIYLVKKHVGKGNNVDDLRWNLEVEPFVVQ